ncbi:MAG: PEGA domain-containing protein, partial [Spirochaetia bacterium]|nr:PEGA domain-containing protein [Spirochaetia bacterium]
VQTLIDADVVSMEEAIVRFGQKLSGSVDSVGFFFYAGHGVQHNGSNYLIPAGAKIASEVFLRTRSISAQAVLDTMQAAGNRLNIVVLDACRDNPFGWARSGQRGLSVVASQPPGSIIAYATSAGSVAGDGDGRNGIFTEELLRILAMPGIDVSELFRLTGQAVQERTAGRQIPAIYSQFFGKKTLLGSHDTGSGEPVSTPVKQPKAPLQSAAARLKTELFIESNLLGADITIDGKAKGKTPLFLDDVIPGTILTVEVRLGTMSANETYRVIDGFNQLTMVLEQEKGTLIIQNYEADAELYLDGVRIGTVGSGLVRDVDAGRRTVEIRVPGRKAVHAVEIAKDTTTRLIPEFEGNSYTVSFDATGGRLTGISTKQVRYQEAYGELPAPQREGYTFGGWWTSPNRGGSQVLGTTKYTQTQDQRLYASWSANTYTVSFDSQGGGEPSARSKSVTYGQPYGVLPTVTRTGYFFAGWWTEPNKRGMEVLSSTTATMTGYQTLYAKWIVLAVGGIGPSGGYVFYDKGYYSNGWRYLEAAPAGWSGGSGGPGYIFGYHRPARTNIVVGGTGTGIGSGKENTQKLVGAMGLSVYSSSSGSEKTAQYAARLCAEYRGGGYDDWFLPSKDELNLMYQNLKRNNLGGFSGDFYWSSSEYGALDVWLQSFFGGNQYVNVRYVEARVRPVRAC